MKYNQFKIKARVWLYPGKTAWHFISVPKQISKEIESGFSDRKRGWGSLPIIVKVGNSTWATSIFPDKKTGMYLLPLKSEIRQKENISADQTLNILFEIKI